MGKNSKDLDSMYREMMNNRQNSEDPGARLFKFVLGIIMFGVGVFMILQNTTVSSTWGSGGYFYHIGNFGISNGLITLPFFIGIGMLFFMRKRIFGWIVSALGLAFILLTIIANTNIHWRTSSAYVFVIMFGLTAAGAGLILKELFRKD